MIYWSHCYLKSIYWLLLLRIILNRTIDVTHFNARKRRLDRWLFGQRGSPIVRHRVSVIGFRHHRQMLVRDLLADEVVGNQPRRRVHQVTGQRRTNDQKDKFRIHVDVRRPVDSFLRGPLFLQSFFYRVSPFRKMPIKIADRRTWRTVQIRQVVHVDCVAYFRFL